MPLAIVFDSAGTLLRTVRSVVDFTTKKLLPDTVETTLLTFEDEARILVMLEIGSAQLLEADGTELLSSWLAENDIGYAISCGRNIVDTATIGRILLSDRNATVGDLQLAVAACKKEATKTADVFAMNAGAIVNTRTSCIEFGISSAGYPFPGVHELIRSLEEKGVGVYIASGDRPEKLELVADRIGIPRDHVTGVATPARKAAVVAALKKKYDTVIMTGDGINDLAAMRAADIAILTLQQNSERPKILKETADHVVHDIRDVAGIVDATLDRQ